MGDIYMLMIIALVALAVTDLVVGVSNDAVNFLNSAIGSKAVSLRNIMIIASLGIFFGAVFSSGMMEVARKGIFIPGQFYFNEIMIIFMAVMITDILLLDLFNTLGIPTSTTVSIVFELLGAAVAMALIKISAKGNPETIADLGKYINSEKALLIIAGILFSVIISFSIGAIVQYLTRLVFSFHYEKKMKYFGAIFGGICLTGITYFIFIKGLKGTPYYDDIKHSISGNELYIIGISFIFWTIISQLYGAIFKKSILVLVIIFGTFGLALAFAGNDLVNFIGVPMAAWHSYEAWKASGVEANLFSMEVLSKKVPTESTLLFIAGAIMVLTLWFSKKARSVAETEINLARQGEGKERFKSNFLSRIIVRGVIIANRGINKTLPKGTLEKIDKQFQKPVLKLSKDKMYELPAFDLIRASINLVVAGILISIATTVFVLPLSTTYVTFMVAMGTSLADKAWGRESAVYRVAGVINVILGWFATALIAFTAGAILTSLISLGGEIGGPIVIAVLLILAGFLIVRSYISHAKKEKEKKEKEYIRRAELITINEVIEESSNHVSKISKWVSKLYNSVVKDLDDHDLNKLYKTDKNVRKLKQEVSDLKNDVFYFIRSLDDSSVKASKFYILILSYLEDISQSIEYIVSTSFKHVNNNHKPLKKGQISDLKEINTKLNSLLETIEQDFDHKSFNNLSSIINSKQELLNEISSSIDKQISRIRLEESSPKNATLYLGILLETKDLISSNINLMQLFQDFNNSKNA